MSACSLGGGNAGYGAPAATTAAPHAPSVSAPGATSAGGAGHGSQFSVKDGTVVSGPASSPLPAAPIKITGTSIELG